ncbi:MAG: hypothetical protein ACTSPI_02810 [Candidatus Heimdallarchaeaceae archaeon]
MKLSTYYPYLKGIRKLTETIEDTITTPAIEPKYTFKKYQFAQGGFLEYLMINFSRTDANLKIRYDEFALPERSCDECNDYGYTRNDTNTIFCNQYDDYQGNYVMIYQPDNLLGFNKELVIETQCSSSYTIQNCEIMLYEIINEKLFWDSFRDLQLDYSRISNNVVVEQPQPQPKQIEQPQQRRRLFRQ